MTKKLNCPACHSTDVAPFVEAGNKTNCEQLICNKCLHTFMPAEGEQTATIVYRKHYKTIIGLTRKLSGNVISHRENVGDNIDWAAVGVLTYVISLLEEAADFVQPVKGTK